MQKKAKRWTRRSKIVKKHSNFFENLAIDYGKSLNVCHNLWPDRSLAVAYGKRMQIGHTIRQESKCFAIIYGQIEVWP